MDGVAEFAFDGAVAVGGNDFSAVVFPHVKSINGGAFFGGNFGGDDIDVQFRELLRDGVQKTNAVFSFDFEEGPSFRSFVIEMDASGDAFAGVGLVKWPADLVAGDELVEIHVLAGKGAIEHLFKFVALIEVSETAGFGVGDAKGIEHDAVVARENLRAENVQA